MAGGRKCVPLSSSAKAVLKSGTVGVKWFQEFYKEHNELKELNPRDEDHARHEAACEATVNEHFDGQFGLRAAFKHAGVMDENGHIPDKRRIVNKAECPQFVDFFGKGGNWAVHAGASKRNPKKQRLPQCGYDLGFRWFSVYGIHIIIDRTELNAHNIPDTLGIFDQRICEFTKVSSYGMLTTNDHGVQTGISLIAWLHMFKLELIHRGVPSPIVILSDNHSSREVREVMNWLVDNSYENYPEDPYYTNVPSAFLEQYKLNYPMHMCTEPSNSSGFLQALDQLNRKWHEAYKRGIVQMRYDQQNEKLVISLDMFFEIVCMYWFNWCNVLDRQAAFRRVGITRVLNSALDDRSKFHDRHENTIAVLESQAMHNYQVSEGGSVMPIPAKNPTAFQPMSPPESLGYGKGTLEYYKYEFEDCVNRVIPNFQMTPAMPSDVDILKPAPVQVRKSAVRHKVTGAHGSFELRDLSKTKNEKQAAAEEAAELSAHKKMESEAKKKAAEAARLAAQAQWKIQNVDREYCSCRQTFDFACVGGHLCRVCGIVKGRVCGVRECKDQIAAETAELDVKA
jgi:hypothetical protein